MGSQDSFVALFLSSHLCVGSGDLISLNGRSFTVWIISCLALFQTCFSWVVGFSQWYTTCLWCSQSPGFKSQHQHNVDTHTYTHKYIDYIDTQRDRHRHTHRHTHKHTYHIDTSRQTHTQIYTLHRHRHTKTHIHRHTPHRHAHIQRQTHRVLVISVHNLFFFLLNNETGSNTVAAWNSLCSLGFF